MLGLTRRELETELRDGLRHRQRAKAVGNCYSPIPKATAPVLDPTCEGVGMKFPRATRPLIHTFALANMILHAGTEQKRRERELEYVIYLQQSN